MKKVYLLFITILTLEACSEYIPFNLPEDQLFLVVNAIKGTQDSIEIRVQKSVFILDDYEKKNDPGNVLVQLKKDGQLITCNYNTYSRVFEANISPEEGALYEIIVDNGIQPIAKATCKVPDKTNIIGIDTSTVTTVTTSGEKLTLIKWDINFNDIAEAENFYLIRILSGYTSYIYDINGNIADSSVSLDYLYFNESPAGANNYETVYFKNTNAIIFTDKLFNGKNYTLNAYTSDYFSSTDNTHITIELSSIPKDVYLFMYSYKQYTEAGDFFSSEPVNVYSNITGGLGIFGFYTTSVKKF